MQVIWVLAAMLPWLLLFGGAVYLIHLWKRPGPEQLHRAEVDELREQVSLMRDFIRDAMERIRRLEEGRGREASFLPGGDPRLPGPSAPSTADEREVEPTPPEGTDEAEEGPTGP
ncbi:MAG: hypothetical protein PVI57_03405 [Gemmatimonadota bacterium]|jgi:hypothetical protein